MASGPELAANGPDPDRRKLSPEDEHILQQPYAEAVAFMGYREDLILHAIKMLRFKQNVLEVGRILLEVEKLQDTEKRGGTLPPLESQKVPEHHKLNGERECEPDDAEVVDAKSSDNANLQTDGEEQAMPHKARDIEVPEREGKDDSVQKKEGTAALQLKLKALRHENQLLKARQLCRSCHQRSVSITFLPCGHYSYCYDCGQSFGACPICHKTILADVRTFMA